MGNGEFSIPSYSTNDWRGAISAMVHEMSRAASEWRTGLRVRLCLKIGTVRFGEDRPRSRLSAPPGSTKSTDTHTRMRFPGWTREFHPATGFRDISAAGQRLCGRLVCVGGRAPSNTRWATSGQQPNSRQPALGASAESARARPGGWGVPSTECRRRAGAGCGRWGAERRSGAPSVGWFGPD